jgi:ribonuclease P protein component
VAKSVGNSVVRHRVARKLRHAITPILPLLPSGSLLVARAFPQSATDISSSQLSAEFEVALKKALI